MMNTKFITFMAFTGVCVLSMWSLAVKAQVEQSDECLVAELIEDMVQEISMLEYASQEAVDEMVFSVLSWARYVGADQTRILHMLHKKLEERIAMLESTSWNARALIKSVGPQIAGILASVTVTLSAVMVLRSIDKKRINAYEKPWHAVFASLEEWLGHSENLNDPTLILDKIRSADTSFAHAQGIFNTYLQFKELQTIKCHAWWMLPLEIPLFLIGMSANVTTYLGVSILIETLTQFKRAGAVLLKGLHIAKRRAEQLLQSDAYYQLYDDTLLSPLINS